VVSAESICVCEQTDARAVNAASEHTARWPFYGQDPAATRVAPSASKERIVVIKVDNSAECVAFFATRVRGTVLDRPRWRDGFRGGEILSRMWPHSHMHVHYTTVAPPNAHSLCLAISRGS